MSGKSFLAGFETVLHAAEAAATIAAPVIATMDPTIGGLMLQAVNTAVGMEGAITTPGSGAQKLAAVAGQTTAMIGMTNALLVAQGKAQLPANTVDLIQVGVKGVVTGLNTLAAVKTAA